MALPLPEGRFPTNSWQLSEKSRSSSSRVDKCKWNSSPQPKLLLPAETQSSRRQLCIGASLIALTNLNLSIISPPARAEEDKEVDQQENGKIVDRIKSLFDPNEKTESGKMLPKAYVKSVREVVKTLRESLKENPKDTAKFRRTADSAKEPIRDFLNNWRGQPTVTKEESYKEVEKAIRSLASFYSKAGPSASLSNEVKSEILQDLENAEKFL